MRLRLMDVAHNCRGEIDRWWDRKMMKSGEDWREKESLFLDWIGGLEGREDSYY